MRRSRRCNNKEKKKRPDRDALCWHRRHPYPAKIVTLHQIEYSVATALQREHFCLGRSHEVGEIAAEQRLQECVTLRNIVTKKRRHERVTGFATLNSYNGRFFAAAEPVAIAACQRRGYA